MTLILLPGTKKENKGKVTDFICLRLRLISNKDQVGVLKLYFYFVAGKITKFKHLFYFVSHVFTCVCVLMRSLVLLNISF